MKKEKLILSQLGNKFYLSVPEEIYIGRFKKKENILDEDVIIVNFKYNYFFRDEDVNYTEYYYNIGYNNYNKGINVIYLKDDLLIIPKDTFELRKDIFDRLRKLFKKYDCIFEIELREFYSDDDYDFENYKVNIDYEMIKLENPIKNKDYLFRLKDNNIPIGWVEQSKYLLKKRENLNAKYGNISCEKINLIEFDGTIPKNIDFVLSKSFSDRLNELFKSWNNNCKKTKRMLFIEFLYENYFNKITINNDYYTIKLNDKFSILIDVQTLQILEVKTNYYNLKISYLDELNRNIDKIKQKINELNN